MKLRRIIPLLICFNMMAMEPDRKVYVQHKAAHAVVGIGVAWVGHELGYPKTGLAVAFGLGVAKELYDRKHGGKFRGGDVAWTTLPAVTVSYSLKW
jgi:hypothetical protein